MAAAITTAARPLQLVAYYRVSTARQGESGLGLEAQRAKVEALAADRGAVVVADFVEVESGRKADRPQLAAALAEARKRGAAVAVAKIDRLARDAELVLRLSREAAASGMGGFLFCDLPDVDATTAAGKMVLSVMASVAEFEAGRISERTRDALAAAKRYNALAREHGLSPTQMALAFCYTKWQVASTIIGVTSLAQLDECLDAWGTRLSPELLASIDQIRWEMRDPAL